MHRCYNLTGHNRLTLQHKRFTKSGVIIRSITCSPCSKQIVVPQYSRTPMPESWSSSKDSGEMGVMVSPSCPNESGLD